MNNINSYVMLLCFVLLESRGDYAETPNAFIFSLNNYGRLAPFLSKPKVTGAAIDDRSYYGPKFGSDLIIDLDFQSHASLGTHYYAPASVNKAKILKGPGGDFSPDEVEVFYLDSSR